MAKQNEKQTEQNNNIYEFELSNGKKLTLDLSKNTGHLLMTCRKISGGQATVIYMISEMALFDGQKIPAPEILNWSAFEVLELEDIYTNFVEKK